MDYRKFAELPATSITLGGQAELTVPAGSVVNLKSIAITCGATLSASVGANVVITYPNGFAWWWDRIDLDYGHTTLTSHGEDMSDLRVFQWRSQFGAQQLGALERGTSLELANYGNNVPIGAEAGGDRLNFFGFGSALKTFPVTIRPLALRELDHYVKLEHPLTIRVTVKSNIIDMLIGASGFADPTWRINFNNWELYGFTKTMPLYRPLPFYQTIKCYSTRKVGTIPVNALGLVSFRFMWTEARMKLYHLSFTNTNTTNYSTCCSELRAGSVMPNANRIYATVGNTHYGSSIDITNPCSAYHVTRFAWGEDKTGTVGLRNYVSCNNNSGLDGAIGDYWGSTNTGNALLTGNAFGYAIPFGEFHKDTEYLNTRGMMSIINLNIIVPIQVNPVDVYVTACYLKDFSSDETGQLNHFD